MELSSFKEILLKKAESLGNKNLSTLIEYMGEDNLTTSVVDALEKMARLTNNTGKNANGALASFGANMDKTDATQMKDALSHHVSHYKAALAAHHAAPEGSPEKTKMRDVADKHLEHVIPLMHLASRAAGHSKGNLDMDIPDLGPWETNFSTLDRNENGRYKRDAKLLNARTKGAANAYPSSIKPNVKDYHYLEMAPHHGHDKTGAHTGGYPFEQIQMGSPKDIDAGKAHLHIQDVADKKEYTPHPFDSHPIRSIADVYNDHISPEMHQKYAADTQGWRQSDKHKEWMAGQKEAFSKDPEGYKTRGHQRAGHVFEGLPLRESPDHVKAYPRKQAVAEGSAPDAPAEKPSSPVQSSPAQATPAAVAPKKRTPKPAEGSAEHPLEGVYQAWTKMPPDQQKAMMNIPAFRDYASRKK